MNRFWLIRALLMVSLFSPLVAKGSDSLAEDVKEAIQTFRKKDKGMKKFFDESLGYVVFPNVGKGGFIIGGAHGNGLVYEKHNLIGRASLMQATIGFQAGGQEFSEIVFFESEQAMNDFKDGQFSVSAQVSAVIAADGAAQKAKYHRGVAIFLLPKGGLMLEASVGGQKFTFKPLSKK